MGKLKLLRERGKRIRQRVKKLDDFDLINIVQILTSVSSVPEINTDDKKIKILEENIDLLEKLFSEEKQNLDSALLEEVKGRAERAKLAAEEQEEIEKVKKEKKGNNSTGNSSTGPITTS